MKNKERNYAFIDGQNLYQGLDWNIDHARFRVYLRDKYNIEKAYYFLWFKEKENALYEKLQEAGFILIFNEKPQHLKSQKKGNIDVNLVFYAMKKLYDSVIWEEKEFDKIVLVSWDGDFKGMVDFFVEKWKFLKILFPNKKYASSLYNDLTFKYMYYLNDAKHHLEYKKRGS